MQSQLTVRLPDDLVNGISDVAKNLHFKRSDVVRLALEHFLEEFRTKTKKEEKPYDKVKNLIGTVSSGGDHYVIQRGGRPMALIGPVEEAKKERSMGELKRLLDQLPKLGKEVDAFEKDVKEIRTHQPMLPAGEPWE